MVSLNGNTRKLIICIEYHTNRMNYVESRRRVRFYLFIYLQDSPYTAGASHRDNTPLTGPLCRGGGDSPQHRHYPTLIDKCVGSFKSPIERRETRPTA